MRVGHRVMGGLFLSWTGKSLASHRVKHLWDRPEIKVAWFGPGMEKRIPIGENPLSTLSDYISISLTVYSIHFRNCCRVG